MPKKKSRPTQGRSTAQDNARRAAAKAAQIRHQHEREERRRRIRMLSFGIGALLVLALVTVAIVQSTRDTTGSDAAAPAGAAGYAVPIGPADAPVTVDVYEDFLCPFCRDFEQAMGDTLVGAAEDGDLRVRYHPIAFLDRLSNGTEYSSRAANAFAVVRDEAGREEATAFHDLLFENQPPEGSDGLTDAQLIELAVEAGATEAAVSGPIRDRAFDGWVENGTDEASRDGVNSTPTVMVDGEVVEFETLAELRASLEQAIADARD